MLGCLLLSALTTWHCMSCCSCANAGRVGGGDNTHLESIAGALLQIQLILTPHRRDVAGCCSARLHRSLSLFFPSSPYSLFFLDIQSLSPAVFVLISKSSSLFLFLLLLHLSPLLWGTSQGGALFREKIMEDLKDKIRAAR